MFLDIVLINIIVLDLIVFVVVCNNFMSDLGPTQPLIQWIPGAFSLGVKQLGMKLTTYLHLVLKSVCGAIPPLPQYVFMVWCLVKQRDSFTFTVRQHD
jgi:hypothetical protein